MNGDNVNVGMFTRVEEGSRLELSVTGDPSNESDTFVASARLLIDSGEEKKWVDHDLNPGPQGRALSQPRLYVIRIRVLFAGSQPASAVVRGVIRKPNGSVHSTPYVYKVSGTKDDKARRATLLIVTLKS